MTRERKGRGGNRREYERIKKKGVRNGREGKEEAKEGKEEERGVEMERGERK